MVYLTSIKHLLLTTMLSVITLAHAETTNLVVGFPPGGGQHTVAQLIASNSTIQLSVKPGVQGVLAMNSCVTSTNALCLTTQGQMVYAIYDSDISKSVKYSNANIRRLMGVGRSPTVLVAASGRELSLRNIKTTATFGSGTSGLKHSIQQIITKLELNNAVVVNYKGVGPTIIDILGGHIDYALVPWSTVSAYVKSNKLSVIATTDTEDIYLQQTPLFKSVLGLTLGDTVFAILEPTTASVSVTEMYNKLNKLINTSEFRKSLRNADIEPLPAGFNTLNYFVSQQNSL